ncbi:MAG: DNA alkylation repair protein [Ruminococcaceae bacterium]|nr:DNA alkylation repair protein [Oscillospiraceae bacterium]
MTDIKKFLFENGDREYKRFQGALMPTVDPERVIGVRTPVLRKFAKGIDENTAETFMKSLPHTYYEEDNLHAFLIERIKDFDRCIEALDRFLPFVDNWATCDSMNPKILKTDKARLLSCIDRWIGSDKVYTVRFAIGLLMRHFLGEDFKTEYAERVAAVTSDEYYVNMMQAWYFATALAYQPEAILPYFEERRLPAWVHNKAIQKARESYRIPKEHKEYLKTLKELSR